MILTLNEAIDEAKFKRTNHHAIVTFCDAADLLDDMANIIRNNPQAKAIITRYNNLVSYEKQIEVPK